MTKKVTKKSAKKSTTKITKEDCGDCCPDRLTHEEQVLIGLGKKQVGNLVRRTVDKAMFSLIRDMYMSGMNDAEAQLCLDKFSEVAGRQKTLAIGLDKVKQLEGKK